MTEDSVVSHPYGMRKPAHFFQHLIRANRRSRLLGLVGRLSEKYLRAYYNENFFVFDKNGESFVMKTYATWAQGRETTIWDVGANAGQWSTEASNYSPNSTIHAFEILQPIGDAFEKRMTNLANVHLHRMGLSDEEGEIFVTWNQEHDQSSAIDYRQVPHLGTELRQLPCKVTTIDRLIGCGLAAPTFLKIDTEGHDAAVLRGARSLLKSTSAPVLIQFEYGGTWIPARETLEACQKELEDAGYKVGRLFPRHVEFKHYEYRDDHFRMGNMIAAKSADLIEALKG